jgi:hypothetical protein
MLYISHKIIVSGDKAKQGPRELVEGMGLYGAGEVNRVGNGREKWGRKEMFNIQCSIFNAQCIEKEEG